MRLRPLLEVHLLSGGLLLLARAAPALDDDFGYAAVEGAVTMADFHATVLHLLGLEHRKVRFDHEGREESLTGTEPARVVEEILA